MHKTISEHNKKRLEEIGLLLHELRLNECMTQKELSDNIDLHRNTIIRIENSKNVTLISLFEIIDYYNINLCELFADVE